MNWFGKYKIFYLLLLTAMIACNNRQNADTLFRLKDSSETGIRFENTIRENDSINFVKNFYVYNGAGVATADFNNDGLMDIYFTANVESGALYLNKGSLKFTDVTKEAGCTTSGWCTGVSVVDINNDSFNDIYISRAGSSSPALRENLLFVNKGVDKNGVPHFEEAAKQYGINDNGYTTQSVFFDYDKDGDLDLFLLNHSLEKHNPNEITPFKKDGSGLSVSSLYRNDGNHFVNVSKQACILCDGMGLGVAVNDYNMDGWPDIYVSNDFLAHDFLYVNNGNGTFTEKGEEYFKHYSQFSMGTDAADINNDGWPDIVTVDMLPYENYRRQMMPGPMNYNQYNMALKAGYQPQFMRNTLQLSNGVNAAGIVTYSEVGQMAGIDATDWSWAPLLADFDNDGLKDLFISNGYKRFVINMDFIVYHIGEDGRVDENWNEEKKIDKSLKMPGIDVHNFVYRNKDGQQFEDKSMDWGFDAKSYSNGSVYADLDNDGDLDLVVSNIDKPAFVYENRARQMGQGNYLDVLLVGPASNAAGVGAKAWLFSNGAMQYQYQNMVHGYQSASDKKIHFGLGVSAMADSLLIEWPDGKIQKISLPAANQTLVVNYADASVNKGYKPAYLQPVTATLLKDANKETGIDYGDTDQEFADFNIQFLIPHKFSEPGPKLAAGDVNGDGLDDFYIGGSKIKEGSLFVQQADGGFKSSPVKKQFICEDAGAVFFDADNDRDMDLYVVSGSNEFLDTKSYQDRLYINDGNGNFALGNGLLPLIGTSGSCVKAADFDGDGDMDIFRGGSIVPGSYPSAHPSMLLRNNNGKFENITATAAPFLENAGIITDAEWTDFNNDKKPDLVLAGEFMPVTFLQNKNGRLEKIASTGVENKAGWWNCIRAADIDNDGDMDFIAGNLGLNNYYHANEKEPLTLYAADYNSDGAIDPLMTYYLEGKEQFVAGRDQFIEQIRNAQNLFPDYKTYANTKVGQVLYPEKLKQSIVLKANCFANSIIENLGNNKFSIRQLPAWSQTAPVMDVLAEDFNGDGFADLLLVGNSYSTNVIAGRYDAFTGQVLLNDKKGNYSIMPSPQSGFFADGDGRSVVAVKTKKGKYYVVSQHEGALKIFSR